MLLAAMLLLLIDTAITFWVMVSMISYIDQLADGYIKQQLYAFLSNKVVSAILNFGISWVIAQLTASGFWAGITNLGATVIVYFASSWYIRVHTTLPGLEDRLRAIKVDKEAKKRRAKMKVA